LPPGRKPVETYCVGSALRARAYRYVKKFLDQGQQSYLVCPRVNEREHSETAAAQALYAQLQQGEFANYQLGLLHGKLKPRQKEAVMESFASGQTQLLVSTTVVEVGVDVPNAAIMVIENAEMFGLSQLHQLRGRVGRGAARSTCILISDAENEEARQRFQLMRETCDGFEIARRDLELRGPGEFFGARQHGLPELKIADIAADQVLLEDTRAAANQILEIDPALELPEHQAMRRACLKMIGAEQQCAQT
jgi:ATP-dependent DNA helicase RecG